MSTLEALFQQYGSMQRSEITTGQLHHLKNGLMSVGTSEITSFEDAQHFLLLLKNFREEVAENNKLNGANYHQQLKKLLSVGENGIYSDNLRFMFELIQNVDDCDFNDAKDCRLEIQFSDGKIILRYNEKGFTPFNVFAITGIAEAAKNISAEKNEIGEKGIGFKSVFGVSNSVLIRSGWFSFSLSKENFTVPNADYQNNEYCQGTEMTLFVPPGKSKSIYDEIKKRYCNENAIFENNPLLFLNKLTSLKMFFDGFRTMEFNVSRNDLGLVSKFSKENEIHISVNLKDAEGGREQNYETEIVCARYSYSAAFSKSACKDRYGSETMLGSNGGKAMKLQAVFPYPQYLGKLKNGALYSFLPTQVRLTAPIAAHVPFKLNAAREFVDSQENNIWFKEACRYFIELLDYSYKDWAQTVKNDIVAYLPNFNGSIFKENNGKALSSLPEFKGQHFSNLPIFYTHSDIFAKCDDVFCFENFEKIVEPTKAYELLQRADELSGDFFLIPEGKSPQSIGIRSEKNIYQRLFSAALKKQNLTDVVLQYLKTANFIPTENDSILFSEPLELNEKQIISFMGHKNFANFFKKYAQASLHKGKRPSFAVKTSSFVPIQDALSLDIDLSDAPEKVNRYLKLCHGSAILLNIGAKQYLPCGNVIVLSSINPLSSFSAFCSELDRNDTFSIRLKLREYSERLNNLSDSEEGSPNEYLKELKQIRLLSKEAFGEKQYQAYTNLILSSRADPAEFIQELLQNADDCEYAPEIVPEFSLVKTQSKIITQCNELGFTRQNIRSITAIGESTKNRILNQSLSIGEKGVGFKSVFAIADFVHIHSGNYHFALKKKTPTIPEIISGNHETVCGTRMELNLRQGIKLPSFDERKVLELCLCLRKLKRIQINDTTVTIEDTDIHRTITVNKKQYTFHRFSHKFPVSKQMREDYKVGSRTISETQTIVCYIPDKGERKDYPLYCGLPTKHKIQIPLVIDAPFILTTSRSEIDLGSIHWNNAVRKEMYAALLSVMNTLKCEDGCKILRFAEFKHELHGPQTVYVNKISDCEYLNQYDLLSILRKENLLPTFDKAVFVSAQSRSAFRFPDAANYLFSSGFFGTLSPKMALNIPEGNAFDAVLDALGCPKAPFKVFFPLLQKYAQQHISYEKFREKLYICLKDDVPNENRPFLRSLPIIPVYDKFGGPTRYITWDNNIFVKKGCEKSESAYYVLNEHLLSKSDCEQIFDVNVNEMNFDWERTRYNDALRDKIDESDDRELYNYLLSEFAKDSYTKYDSWVTLRGMKGQIPLKNQLGALVRDSLFICDEPTGHFMSICIRSISVHDECKQLASRLDFPHLSAIHYQDIPHPVKLSDDDIEAFCDDYFVNSEEILRSFYRNDFISDEQVEKYQLDDIVMKIDSSDNYNYHFPEEPVSNFDRLRSHIKKSIQNPRKIVKKSILRTVDMIISSDGRESSPDSAESRSKTLDKYTPVGARGKCYCQMCQTLKPHTHIEVNNIKKDPKYFFDETRISLCLECSKDFEAIRNKDDSKIISAVENAEISPGHGYVDVPISREKSIRFTSTHLAEIQEILRFIPDI